MRALKIMALQTPARIRTVSESETAHGGRVRTFVTAGTVWGDFQPRSPVLTVSGDDAYVEQSADFLCRSAAGLASGGVLTLRGHDWTIASIDEDADGTVRVRLERVHP